jgi:hypothetical protein
MKRWVLPGLIWLTVFPAFCNDQSKPSLTVFAPYVAKINEPFQVEVYFDPPSDAPVTVQMEPRPGLSFSKRRFQLQGSKHQFLSVKITSNPRSGLAWINANGDSGETAWSAVDVSFDGHLKPTWTEPVAYDRPTTLSLAIVDRDGKPIPFDGDLELKLDSVDGTINRSDKQVSISIPTASRVTPQFQLKPLSPWGGNVHLTGVLTAPNYTHVLAQDQFVFTAHPAWWVPVLLALFGGMLHAIYKIVRIPLPIRLRNWLYASIAIVGTSSISALVGYLFADFDLLGLKLDPNVLRTYPIVGFLFSYFGVDSLLSDKLPHLTKPPAAHLPAQGIEASAKPREVTELEKQQDSSSDKDKTLVPPAG